MLNTRDLERRWLKYKIKSFLPYLIITISGAVIVIFVSLYLTSVDTMNNTPEIKQTLVQSKEVVEEKKVSNQTVEKQEAPAIKNIVEPQIIKPIIEKEEHLVLKPSLDFMKKMEEPSNNYYAKVATIQKKDIRVSTTKPKKQQIIEQQTVIVEEVMLEKPSPKETPVVITRKNSLKDIKDAERRFKQNNSPALSLFLAKQYYSLDDYAKAYNYALITNQLDKENEESWIIVSKSLVKLGKIELAKKALNEYIKFSHSSNAELLLDDITTGKFQ